MKKVLVLAAAVCVFATVGSASLLNVWLSANPATTGYYPVQIWAQIVVDPAHPDEVITDNGLCDFSVTLYTPGTVGVTIPRGNGSDSNGHQVVMSWGVNINDWGLKVKANNGDYDADGDKDAVEASAGDTDGFDLNTGIGAPVLLATETWKMVSWAWARPVVIPGATSRHWSDTIDPDTGLPGRELFTAVGAVIVPPPWHWGQPPMIDLTGPTGVGNTGAGLNTDTLSFTFIPEPTTLALLGFGALAALIRRKK
jgi:hypothetical protein